MDQDILQQLRDIHLPAEPGWWPPAIGWWLLAVVLAALLAWALWRLAARWRRFRPARTARSLYREISQELRSGSIAPRQYVHRTNELLKRFAVAGLGDRSIARESGNRWLAFLDARYGQAAFSRGPGRCLGSERFRRDCTVDAAAVDALVNRFFAHECSRCWRIGAKP